jgi:hypothetical protein
MQIDVDRKYRVLDPEETYSFADFFKFAFDVEDILADLDCEFERVALSLIRADVPEPLISSLRDYIEQNLDITNPTAEISRREFLIAPIVRELCRYVGAKVSGEYTIRVNQWLRGSLDYYIRSQSSFVVIEAKQADLAHGFVQLAAELIAIDYKTTSSHPILYGAVTTGEIWRFGQFHRQERRVIEDRKTYRVPEDLEDVFRILVAIAQCESVASPTS